MGPGLPDDRHTGVEPDQQVRRQVATKLRIFHMILCL